MRKIVVIGFLPTFLQKSRQKTLEIGLVAEEKQILGILNRSTYRPIDLSTSRNILFFKILAADDF